MALVVWRALLRLYEISGSLHGWYMPAPLLTTLASVHPLSVHHFASTLSGYLDPCLGMRRTDEFVQDTNSLVHSAAWMEIVAFLHLQKVSLGFLLQSSIPSYTPY